MIDQIRFFLSKREHVHTLISKEIKNVTPFVLLKAPSTDI